MAVRVGGRSRLWNGQLLNWVEMNEWMNWMYYLSRLQLVVPLFVSVCTKPSQQLMYCTPSAACWWTYDDSITIFNESSFSDLTLHYRPMNWMNWIPKTKFRKKHDGVGCAFMDSIKTYHTAEKHYVYSHVQLTIKYIICCEGYWNMISSKAIICQKVKKGKWMSTFFLTRSFSITRSHVIS